MRVYIAEKPSLGRAIAAALPGPQKKGDGYIQVGNGDVVTWCIGHLLEQAAPEAYDPVFKSWQWQTLPIVPQKWQLQPRSSARKQLSVVRQWVKQADELVHAGDPDREGQLLVDEVIDYLGVSQAKRQAVLRCLISDLNPPAVKRALLSLRSNRDFMALSISALTRSRADWLFGINLTRAYTLLARQAGQQTLMSVGRVQTPLLGLVVRRDAEIAAFISRPFYEVEATVQTAEGGQFSLLWQPSAACAPWQDQDGRVLAAALADKVVSRILGRAGRVLEVKPEQHRQAPPLPFNLSSLQMEASRQLSLTAQQTLDLCQRLYEQHKLITYPRSDCRYLPREHLHQAAEVRQAIARQTDALSAAVAAADPDRVSAAWNDAKVSAHHAIIPTARSVVQGLNTQESALYALIARQYLMQFYPHHEYRETRVMVEIEGGHFLGKGKEILQIGWRSLLMKAEREDQPLQPLPPLTEHQTVACVAARRLDKQTQPPKPFTDASLLAAMTGIARYVEDKALRQILRETDGLGTEATRAGMIELLIERGYIQRQGKALRSTPLGQTLIQALPAETTTPDMTAHWEHALSAIEQREQSYQAFMTPLVGTLARLVSEAKAGEARMRPLLAAMPSEVTKSFSGKRRGAGRRTKKPRKRASSSPA